MERRLHHRKKVHLVCAAALCLVAALPAATVAQSEPGPGALLPVRRPAPAGIVPALERDGRFATLLTALRATGLDGALAGDAQLTLFAPTDEAFAALPAGLLDGLLADPDALTEVLLYHVVPGAQSCFRLVREGSTATLAGPPLLVTREPGTYLVNGTVIERANRRVRNGVIHVVGEVLLPPDDAS
jgi:uncharacterized surface protein with fasciclin (FAS1) repeats